MKWHVSHCSQLTIKMHAIPSSFIRRPSINWDILELYQLHYASYQK